MEQQTAGQEKKKYDTIPEGTYRLRMKNYQVKESKAGNTYISAAFELMTDPYKKRLVFETFLLTHPNPKAVATAYDRLTKYLKSVGFKGKFEGEPTILDNYIESPFNGGIVVKTDDQGSQNKVKTFFAQ